MQNSEHTSDKVRAAREVFAAWLRERQAGSGKDFDRLCAAHPDVAPELQALHSAFQLGQAAASSRSFQQTVREQFGDDAEVTVKLEEGAPFVVPPSGGSAATPFVVPPPGGSAAASFGVPPSGGSVRGPAEAGTPNLRYSLEGEVARGGMGIIYRVRDQDLSRTLAMKVMTGTTGSPRQATNTTTRLGLARFLEEAQVTAQLDHPGIVPVHEVGFDAQGQPFFTMKLVKGRDLNEIFKLARAGEGWDALVANKVGRVTPCAPGFDPARGGAHGVTRPTHPVLMEKTSEATQTVGPATIAADKNVRAPKSSPDQTEGWNLPRALGVIVKACQALAYAHSKGVIHRDLKPANIMVGRFGEVFVMDWGLAKITGKKDLHDIRPKDTQLTSASLHSPRHEAGESTPDSPLITMDGSVVGTPAYMPPEQAKGQIEQVDALSDIYSLGAILYNLLTGQPPYVEPGARISPHTILGMVIQGPPKRVHQLNPQAPPELIAICEKAMAREKRDRYTSSLDLAEDLQAFLDHRVVKAYRTGAAAEFKSWVARNKGLASVAPAAAVLAVAGVLAFISQQKQANEELRRNLYAADMKVAHEALKENNRGLAAELVNKYLLHKGGEDLRGWEWRHLWKLCQGKEQFALTGHSNRVMALAFGADNKTLFSGGYEDIVKMWDLAARKPAAAIHVNLGSIRSLATSTNGQTLMIGGDYGVAIRHGPLFAEERRLSEALGSVALSPDGRTLVSGGTNGIMIWDATDWRKLRTLTAADTGDELGALAFSPDGATLATGGAIAPSRIAVKLWNVASLRATASGNLPRLVLEPGTGVVNTWGMCLSFSTDGRILATATDSAAAYLLQLWDAKTGQLLTNAVCGGFVTGIVC